MSAEEAWLADNRTTISAHIQGGWDEAQNGELTDGENVRIGMQQFKGDWKQRRSA